MKTNSSLGRQPVYCVCALVKREVIHEDKMNERLEQVSDKTKHLSAFIKILEEHKTTEAAMKA